MIASSRSGRRLVANSLLARVRADPGALAVEAQGRSITYEALSRHATELAGKLAGLGLERGDRIATVTENDPDQVILFFACAIAGFVLVPLNWRLTGTELAAQLDVASPALVAASGTHWDTARAALRECAQTSQLEPLHGLVEVSAGAGESSQPGADCQIADDDPLLIIFTSGTTGRARGAVLTHANCVWTNISLDRVMPIDASDVVLQVLPQCHVSGWNVQPLQAWFKGATVVIEPQFDPARTLALIAQRRVTTMMGVPTVYRMLAEAPSFESTDLTSLRRVVVGGSAMPHDLVRIWQQRGLPVYQGYGLTEASPNVLCLSAEDAAAHPESVGRPYPYVDVELHDPETGAHIEGAGAGEIWVSGPNVFAGYWGDDEATALKMAGGWLRTGDLAERDGDGFYRIRGRLADCYRSGGENVYPADIEAVLRRHLQVNDVAVVGVPDALWGEAGVAFIEPKAGCVLSNQQVTSYCRDHLAGFKVPRRVIFVSQLPRLTSGKLDRRRLTDLATRSAE